ncbi:alpha/beta hydrolase [Luminiphilus syltensis]|uniref:alpha/beta hydrolase n=1 Tax=Luminiphilus syltensis TaxID=1341119 RepID=UPI00058BECD8|nr:alpha/beta hydrolase [Luminiphilus syltensis]
MAALPRLDSGAVYRQWLPAHTPVATLLLLHGLGEHSGRYQALGERFAQRGIAVFALDHRGHGQSPGPRVNVRHFDDYLPDARALRRVINNQYPELPCFLLGHSMGGLMAARLLLEDQSDYQGVMYSGPAFAAAEPPSPLLMGIARSLAKVFPGTGLMALDASGVSRDPDVVAAYEADPLVHHGKITAGLGVALFDAMDRVMAGAADLTLPTLIMHGGADTLATPGGSRDFFDRLSSADKTLDILPGLYHEIFNEPEGPSVIDQYIDWVMARL